MCVQGGSARTRLSACVRLVLVAALIITMMPRDAFALEGPLAPQAPSVAEVPSAAEVPLILEDTFLAPNSNIVTAFTALPEETMVKTVPLGTKREEIVASLPSNLTATDGTGNTIIIKSINWQCAEYDGSTQGTYHFKAHAGEYSLAQGVNPPGITVVVRETKSNKSVTAFAKLPEHVCRQSGYAPNLPETVDGVVDGTSKAIPVMWESESYSPETSAAGIHVFTAQLSEGYTAAEGAKLPNITFIRHSLERIKGVGSSTYPLQITSAEQLAEIATLANAGTLEAFVGQATVYVRLEKDLDLSGYALGTGWTPIGNAANPFKGAFDGNGKTLTGLRIDNTAADGVGLFGTVCSVSGSPDSGVIQNLGLSDTDIIGSRQVGGIVGRIDGTIRNCFVTGKVEGTQDVGGVAGYTSGTIDGCYSTANIQGASARVGGITGTVADSGDTLRCYATGTVSGTDEVGGIAGSSKGTVEDCVALNSSVTATGSHVGRVTGTSGGTIIGSEAFDGLLVNNDVSVFPIGPSTLNGDSKTAADLQAPSGFPSSFSSPAAGWTFAPGALPGLFGKAVCLPAHLFDKGPPFAGAGTAMDPYTIHTAAQLADLAHKVKNDDTANPLWADKHYVLMANLDLSSYASDTGWMPIGYSSSTSGISHPFKGTFNGNGKTVKGLSITNSPAGYQGLFGAIENGTVKNLLLADVSIAANGNSGGLVGSLHGGVVEQCAVFGTVTGSGSGIGGIAGTVRDGIVRNCYTTAAVKGFTQVGGITGSLTTLTGSARMEQCAALNLFVIRTGSSDAGRVVGKASGTLANNVAFTGMMGATSSSSQSWIGSGLSHKNGGDMTASTITNDGTLGNRFPDGGNPWNSKNGFLPGLDDGPIDIPLFMLPTGKPFEGSGTSAANPYKIHTATQLAEMARLVNTNTGTYPTAYYRLMNDIDLSDYAANSGWTPIGNSTSAPFKGKFDGDNHVVSGLHINTSAANAGLFGIINNNGSVKNLSIADAEIGGAGDVGGIAGQIASGIVENCHVVAKIEGSGNNVGGIAGQVKNWATIKNCDAFGTVRGNDNVGGIAGFVSGASAIGAVNGSYAGGTVTGRDKVGGIAGWVGGGGSVERCYATGAAHGRDQVGGIIGGAAGQVTSGSKDGLLKNCYATASVGGRDKVGGVVGIAFGITQNCYATGTVNATGNSVGGVAGWVDFCGTVERCAALNPEVIGGGKTGRVTGQIVAGGTVSDCYAFEGLVGTGGTNMTSLDAIAPDFWCGTSSSLAWDSSTTWQMVQGALPLLRDGTDVLPGQSGDPGIYLTLFPQGSLSVTATPSPATPGMAVTVTASGWEGWSYSDIRFTASDNKGNPVTVTPSSTQKGLAGLVVPSSARSIVVTAFEASNNAICGTDTIEVISEPDKHEDGDGSNKSTDGLTHPLDNRSPSPWPRATYGSVICNTVSVPYAKTADLLTSGIGTQTLESIVNNAFQDKEAGKIIKISYNGISNAENLTKLTVTLNATKLKENEDVTFIFEAPFGVFIFTTQQMLSWFDDGFGTYTLTMEKADLKVDVRRDGESIAWNRLTPLARIGVTCTLEAAETAAALVLTDEKGHILPTSTYDKGMIYADIFAVGTHTVTSAKANVFTDTSTHWANESIEYVTIRELTSGIDTAYRPDAPVTRADFLMALGKLSDTDVSSYRRSSFTDVLGTSPAMPYIEWMVHNNVAQGIGPNRFAPSEPITYEQMAAILAHYRSATGFTSKATQRDSSLNDAETMNTWIADAITTIRHLSAADRDGGTAFLNFQSKVTRAEAAIILHRFTEQVISSHDAYGWSNDNYDPTKRVHYNQNGNRLSGWQTIGEDTYYFDAEGILCTEWQIIDGEQYYFYEDGKLATDTTINGYAVGKDGARP